ncbi:hypothetical protein D9M70_523730 [compost metagenome]
MRSLLVSRTSLIWFLLIAATVLSWEVGHGIGFSDVRHAGIAIIVVSFIKARFVILEFMEVRHAPLSLRLGCEAWIVLVCAALVVLFMMAPVSTTV